MTVTSLVIEHGVLLDVVVSRRALSDPVIPVADDPLLFQLFDLSGGKP